jgi:hypothetical protein
VLLANTHSPPGQERAGYPGRVSTPVCTTTPLVCIGAALCSEMRTARRHGARCTQHGARTSRLLCAYHHCPTPLHHSTGPHFYYPLLTSVQKVAARAPPCPS